MPEFDPNNLKAIYRQRFTRADEVVRQGIWEVLCKHWIQRYIPTNATVLDLAAGKCEFINNITCGTKIAVDLNEDVREFAAPDVRVVMAYSHDMAEIREGEVDVVFVSNFFEHLPDKKALMDTLTEIKRVLKPGGKLLILQPNIRFLNGQYWDFVDHLLPLTDRTLVEALGLIGMNVDEVRPQFLPYTTRSRTPKWPFLVRLYLMFPIVHRIMGKQAWVVASKPMLGGH